MRKHELASLLAKQYFQDEEELREMTKAELDELYRDLTDHSDMYPNGRDSEAEDEDS